MAMTYSRLLLAIFFVAAGTGHFISPSVYVSIMPFSLPWAAALVKITGAAEICGGLGVLPRLTRPWAGWGLIALLVAVFPANIHALSTGMTIAGHDVPAWLLWARLPFQVPLIWWVYRVCLRQKQ